jgi:hypothetical protein
MRAYLGDYEHLEKRLRRVVPKPDLEIPTVER